MTFCNTFLSNNTEGKFMKLSVENYTLITKFGDFKAFEMIKDAGFDCVDYSYYWENEKEEVLGEKYKEYAESLREKLDEIGLECNQAHAPFSLHYGAKFDIFDNKYLQLVHSIEAAAILGAKNIVVHSLTVPQDVDFVKYNVEYYKSLVPYCEKFGINVAVENLFARDSKRNRIVGKLGTPEELNAIVEKIDSPHIVACIDIGHASLTGYEPENFIEKMNPKILKALHVQDTDYLSDSHTLPYLSKLDWEKIMSALKKVEYDGDFTFEITGYMDNFPDELVSEALKFAVSVGKYLISLYEK